MTADIDTTITIVRTIDAPVAEVFAAWTDAALMRRWLAPDPCTVPEAEADARVGARYRIVVEEPSGTRHITSGEYLEIVPNERIVETWVYEGPGAPDPYPTTLTVSFREIAPNQTELTIQQDRLLTPMDREGNREGWRQCLNKLEAVLVA